ncbi:dTDP-4-dehydrorhamnose reductase [Pseudoroseomonas wenyumeiae]|uniref:dTDP-4-dehydrorhamnose reductase n=1 Tax=Teichococcus wenyumeiae TaxID=2478470 RepID=A0A3A9JHH5_9PROT|nr:dTDP-4-dehydrorhamnose reductase [Pseudoroseomonas wenyumeiae]RKK03034.1 dTDP-4-dehydrorhamnose reductase [Pseudoroseomonas wenyumeiae]RMI15528.1 dTDP-4-dehydrorhamnose reductase [Pseudoroseomonas wenyumeiae]
MRVLVAGRTGQLAVELLERLPRDGHKVVALEAPELDLTDPESIRRAVEQAAPEAIINAAAYTAVDKAESQRDLAFAVNAIGAGMLAAAAAARDLPFLHVSTDYVFSGDGGAPYDEDASTGPMGVYGESKLAGERAVLAANPRSAIIRTAWVCSPHGANFVKTMLRLGREREAVSVVADQHGAPTFAADLADAMARMLPRLAAAPAGDPAFGVFHLTGAPWTTWHGFAEAIFAGAAARGHKVPRLSAITTADYPTPARRPADGRLQCGRITRIHGIEAADWRQSLSRCLDALIGPQTQNS